MKIESIPTRGRTLDHAAAVYDLLEPLFLLGKQAEYDRHIIRLLNPGPGEHVLDLGCGTGVLCERIAQLLDPEEGGMAVGIDAAGKMIEVARKKREGTACRFEAMAAEELGFEDHSFDAVVSSLFFHHVQSDLKARALNEAYRVLKPGGRLIIADMHVPTTWMGALVSKVSRWFFLQPQIAENTKGVLPGLIKEAGFPEPQIVAEYFGYIAVFYCEKNEST